MHSPHFQKRRICSIQPVESITVAELAPNRPHLVNTMRDYALIYANGHRHELRGHRVFQSLSDFLRYELQLTGTKVVCAEGDCGSCTLFIGRLNGDRIEYTTVCSCIQYLFQLDGCHVVTIEGLKYGDELNPVQQSMVKCQGTQCGFCTPGFVASMYATLQSGPVTEHALRRGLVGNLCRCTGYEPILKAGLDVPANSLKSLDVLYPRQAMIADMRAVAGEAIEVRDGGKTFYRPTTVAEAAKLKSEPSCVVISGGTDLGVQMNKGLRELHTVLSLSGLEELTRVEVTSDAITLGSRVTLSILQSTVAEAIPAYGELMEYFGSPPIKNAGTIGGNICNGSPIADTVPALLALGATLELAGPNGVRQVPFESFYTGYKKNVMAADELLVRVIIPKPGPHDVLKLYKISKRKDLDISSVTAGFCFNFAGEVITSARVIIGGVGPTVGRLAETEAVLTGQPLSAELFERAAETAEAEIAPIGDVRGSKEYRLRIAGNLVRKCYVDLSGSIDGRSNGNGFHGNGNGHGSIGRSAVASRM